jgi:adenosylmethionine-8-amino-7-oxononanoate aminotransferase
LGHSETHVQAAVAAQIAQLPFAHTSFFTSEPAERLAQQLVALAPEGLTRVYPVSGGSEAVEAAIKLARQYFVERGETQRHRIIARRQSYHGNTLGALAAGGNLWRRAPFADLMVTTSHIAPCYAYRDQRVDESEFDYGQRVANELEAEILRLGPDQVMAFLAEPVVGATSGAVPAVPGYLKRIREICDQYGVLLILDEVMCGMGRTGTVFACTQDEVTPDILTVAKGLGAGYQPVGAMLCTETIYQAVAQGSGFFQHGHTYLAHPVAMAAASAVLDLLPDLMPQVQARGEQLKSALCNQFSQHPNVGDIRGRGLFVGIELVADRHSKAPFDPSLKLHQHVKRQAMAAGLMCYPAGGTLDGQRGDHILLAPPFIIAPDEVEMVVARLAMALDAALPHYGDVDL